MTHSVKYTNLYGYPDMGRYGLGHSLLAWARCVVWCEKMGAEMLAPRWLRLRIGPYLRRERDKREYFKLFNSKGLIGEPQRSWLLLSSNKVCADDGFFTSNIFSKDLLSQSRKTVFIFNNALADNTKKHFREVFGYSSLLKSQLTQIVRLRHRPKNVDPLSIAIHVRMGDFKMSTGEEAKKNNNTRLPLEWYVSVLKNIRQGLGFDVSAIVYSDGTDDELKLLLQLPSIKRAPKQESITDLLSISEAPALIASGSGFSLWGAFLGQVPSVYYPGRLSVRSLDDKKLEVESDGQDLLPVVFIEHVKVTLEDRGLGVKVCT